MGQTAISWTATVLPDNTTLPGYTFNPWIGCTKVSQGCKFCYAETQNNRYQWNRAGWGPGKERKRTSEANWKKPIQWAKEAAAAGIRRRVFCASLADVFDHEAPQEWREDLWNLIEETNHIGGLEWLILTKRPENIERMFPLAWLVYPPNCIRIGVTCEDQANADKRISTLLNVWKGNNFISYEPAIGPVDFGNWGSWLHQVIVGGESGAGCRVFNPDWARSVIAQGRLFHFAVFVKQMGGHPNKRHDPAEWPEDLRVQEFPR